MKIKISTKMNDNKPITIYLSNITAITIIMTKMIFNMSFLNNHLTAKDNNLQLIKTILIIVQATTFNPILVIF